MELGLIATLALFHKLPSMKPISPDGTTGEGSTLNPFSTALLVSELLHLELYWERNNEKMILKIEACRWSDLSGLCKQHCSNLAHAIMGYLYSGLCSL